MGKVIAHAPAKINLVLEVKPLHAEDNKQEKHKLESIFCTTTLADTLIFDFISGSEPFNAQVTIESTDFNISYIKQRDNTLTKTVDHFTSVYGVGFLPAGTLRVQLIKSIPTQAGLGGGSSDAAAMLRMLCWLAQVEPLSEKSLSVARLVGADVPFFLHAPKTGLCAHMSGYGDELVRDLPKPELHLALIKPSRGISTKKAYAAFDAHKEAAESFDATEKLATALTEKAGLETIAALCTNNLEPVAKSLLPRIGSLKKELASFKEIGRAHV
jgi:4-diphosphocytidyl-2-C-methyl-D-erythritol kinase